MSKLAMSFMYSAIKLFSTHFFERATDNQLSTVTLCFLASVVAQWFHSREVIAIAM